MSQCYREQAGCEMDCPCHENCSGGCPCENFKCKYVCKKPEADKRRIYQSKQSQIELSFNQGDFIGIRYDREGYEVFKGIPFATPPIGELRWRPPQPVSPWKEPKISVNVTRQ